MKKSELRQIIREELIKETTEYYRLPKDVIGNQLYSLSKELPGFYQTLSKGNDFDMKQFDAMLSKMQKIKKAAKKFTETDLRKLPKQYK